MGRRRGWFPGSGQLVTIEVHGDDALGTYQAGSADIAAARGMDSHTGTIRAGAFDRTYAGELGPLQLFRGALIGASRSVAPGFNQALPSTTSPTANGVQDLLGRARL